MSPERPAIYKSGIGLTKCTTICYSLLAVCQHLNAKQSIEK